MICDICNSTFFDPDTTPGVQIIGIMEDCQFGPLLMDSSGGNGSMREVGLFIIAKSDNMKDSCHHRV